MTPRERLFALEQFGIKLGLDNITTLVDALGRPDHAYTCVHVAGTNGKGSVTAMVERGLRAAGHRTGRYTSPHLSSIEERIAIDGDAVDAATFDAVTEDVFAVVDDLRASGRLPHPPTFFEVTTAIAFEAFKRAGVTTAVIEVGLGGRFDATNVIAPRITAITSIDFDHERHLGRTLAEIAFEKAGIIKRDTPVVVGRMLPEPYGVIDAVARAQNAPIVRAIPAEHGTPIQLALNGEHQRLNAAVAVEVLKLCTLASAEGTARDAIVTALTDVVWPARLEWLRLGEGCDLLVDAAHNPSGAGALAQYVCAMTGPLPVLLGVMRDKDVEAMVRALAPAASRFVAVNVDSPRALPAHELAEVITRVLPTIPCRATDDVDGAIGELCRDGARAAIGGSIFLVGPLRARLLARGAVPVRYPSKASPFFLS
jgi:dihydrofolate synthase/folylpolyglutamate synthase